MSSAAEAEVRMVHMNGKVAIPIQIALYKWVTIKDLHS